MGRGGRAVERQAVDRGDDVSPLPAAASEVGGNYRSPHVAYIV